VKARSAVDQIPQAGQSGTPLVGTCVKKNAAVADGAADEWHSDL